MHVTWRLRRVSARMQFCCEKGDARCMATERGRGRVGVQWTTAQEDEATW
jgi:hypothetical protein